MPKFFQYLSRDQEEELSRIANQIVSDGKGILAADEDSDSMGRRFNPLGIDNTEETRRLYRQLLVNTDKEIGKYLGGVILTPETFWQNDDNGVPLRRVLADKGVLPGINVDLGTVTLAGDQCDVTTQGLDGLDKKCSVYKKAGACFAKWMCKLTIVEHGPSTLALKENANVLARYASICQQNGIVPIVEPAVLPDGSHDLETCQKVTEQVWSFVYKALMDHHIYLEGTLLKPNMITAGQSCTKTYTPEQVGEATLASVQRCVPVAVPGVAFLSGGQSELQSTINLNAINCAKGRKPWALTFCYGRGLQGSVFETWAGKAENTKAAQDKFLSLSKANSEASRGKFKQS